MIEPLTLQDCTYIAINMRERDRREIYGIRDDGNPVAVARDVMWAVGNRGIGYCAKTDRPICAFGVVEKWPHVWEAFAFATDEFVSVSKQVTKHILTTIKPALIDAGAHRLQCHSHIEHDEAHKWLHFLGATLEAQLTGFGRDGSDYLLFKWSK